MHSSGWAQYNYSVVPGAWHLQCKLCSVGQDSPSWKGPTSTVVSNSQLHIGTSNIQFMDLWILRFLTALIAGLQNVVFTLCRQKPENRKWEDFSQKISFTYIQLPDCASAGEPSWRDGRGRQKDMEGDPPSLLHLPPHYPSLYISSYQQQLYLLHAYA